MPDELTVTLDGRPINTRIKGTKVMAGVMDVPGWSKIEWWQPSDLECLNQNNQKLPFMTVETASTRSNPAIQESAWTVQTAVNMEQMSRQWSCIDNPNLKWTFEHY